MATTNPTVSKKTIEQLNVALAEICQVADIIEGLMIEVASKLGNDECGIQTSISAAERLASNIGFISDLCLSKTGGIECRGSAEKWILPPMYSHYEEKNSQNEVTA